jgi:stage V sporulation protein G
MEITEVRIKLVDGGAERLLAFCSITIDEAFVVRDLKIIGGPSGPFVAMPSRKLCGHCPGCGCKNPLRAGFCNQCGGRLHNRGENRGETGRARLYADIAHPINTACREFLERRIVEEYEAERVRAAQPGYISRYDAIGDEERPASGNGST